MIALWAVLALACASAVVMGVRALIRLNKTGRDDDDAFGPRR